MKLIAVRTHELVSPESCPIEFIGAARGLISLVSVLDCFWRADGGRGIVL